MRPSRFLNVLALAAALGMGALPAQAACNHCGTVISISKAEQEGQASGLGAIAGGVAGAVVGNQFGKGGGNTAMTLLGAGGGAYAGHTVEKNMKRKTVWKIHVRFDDPKEEKTYTFGSEPNLRKGDRVKLRDGRPVLID